MNQHEPEERLSREREGRGRSDAAKRGGAREIERRVAWLRWPLVYWAGGASSIKVRGDFHYRFVEQSLEDRLARRPAGLYAAAIDYAWPARQAEAENIRERVNPAVSEVVPLTDRLVAETLAALQAARRYPKQMPRRVGDLERWRAAAGARLQDIASAIRRLPARSNQGASALLLEAVAHWVGAEQSRPSRQLPQDVLLEAATKPRDECVPATCLAVIALGQRQIDCRLPETLGWWWRCGRVLSEWPAGLIFAAGSRCEQLLELVRRPGLRRLINSPIAAAAVSEYLWAAPEADTGGFLGALPRLASLPGWSEPLAGLAGRVCAFGEPATLVDHLVSWVETCRLHAPDSAGHSAHARQREGLSALEFWLADAAWAPANVNRLMTFLGLHGQQVFSDAPAGEELRWWWERLARNWCALGCLGNLDVKTYEILLKRRLLRQAGSLVRERPELLEQLTGMEDRWLGPAIRFWSRIPADLGGGLARRLFAWLQAAAAAGGDAGSLLYFVDRLCSLAGAPRHRSLLVRHFWLVDLLRNAPDVAQECLDVLIAAEEQGRLELHPLAEVLLRHPANLEDGRDCHRLCLEVAAGNLASFEALFRSKKPRELWDHAADALTAWTFLARFPPVREFLTECAGHEGLRHRVIAWLTRVAFGLRLQARDELQEWLSAWVQPPPLDVPLAESLPQDLRRLLAELAAWRGMASESKPLPERARQHLRRPEAWRRERATLEEMRQRDALPEKAAVRLRNLEQYLSDPLRLQAWVEDGLRSTCAKELTPTRLRALEFGVDKAIRGWWRRVIGPTPTPPGDPRWDTALELCHHVRKNRRVLKALLRYALEYDQRWPMVHPANEAFAQLMRRRGVDFDAWCGPLRKSYTVHAAPWEVYAETDPLRILEMGNLFGTCLSVGREYAFATIANAAEASKRVLYLRNAQGAIVGRRLIGLAPDPDEPRAWLIGFRSYGACDHDTPREGAVATRASPWVRIIFDTFCLEIAHRIGAGLASHPDGDWLWKLSESLRLFAKWYNDGPEPFDWWVAGLDLGDALLGSRGRATLREALLLKLESSWAPWREKHIGDYPPFIRALLWLGDEALPVLGRLNLDSLGLPALSFLKQHTESPSVERFLAERILAEVPLIESEKP